MKKFTIQSGGFMNPLHPSLKNAFFITSVVTLLVTTTACPKGKALPVGADSSPLNVHTYPLSPANANHAKIYGEVLDGYDVIVYTDPECRKQISRVSGQDFKNKGVSFSVEDNTSTQLYIKTATSIGLSSRCEAAIEYIEDSTAPVILITPLPSIADCVSENPCKYVSGWNDSEELVRGEMSETGTFRLYDNPLCSGTPLATGTSEQFLAGARIDISENAVTPIYVQGTDKAGNTSDCQFAYNYREDSTAPSAAPSDFVVTALTPTSVGVNFSKYINPHRLNNGAILWETLGANTSYSLDYDRADNPRELSCDTPRLTNIEPIPDLWIDADYSSIVIESLDPGTEYKFKMCSQRLYGVKLEGATITFRTAPPCDRTFEEYEFLSINTLNSYLSNPIDSAPEGNPDGNIVICPTWDTTLTGSGSIQFHNPYFKFYWIGSNTIQNSKTCQEDLLYVDDPSTTNPDLDPPTPAQCPSEVFEHNALINVVDSSLTLYSTRFSIQDEDPSTQLIGLFARTNSDNSNKVNISGVSVTSCDSDLVFRFEGIESDFLRLANFSNYGCNTNTNAQKIQIESFNSRGSHFKDVHAVGISTGIFVDQGSVVDRLQTHL